MTIDTDKLRELSQQLTGWSNCNHSWVQDDGVAIVGYIDHEAGEFELLRIDTAEYDQPDDAIKLAEFYATANPSAILALLDELDRLRIEVKFLQGTPEVEPKLCEFGEEDDFDEAHYDWELRRSYAEIGAKIYNGNTVSYMYSKARNYGNALIECCRLLGGTGDVRDRIKALQAERDAAHLAGYRLAQEQAAKVRLPVGAFEYRAGILDGSSGKTEQYDDGFCGGAAAVRDAIRAMQPPAEWGV